MLGGEKVEWSKEFEGRMTEGKGQAWNNEFAKFSSHKSGSPIELKEEFQSVWDNLNRNDTSLPTHEFHDWSKEFSELFPGAPPARDSTFEADPVMAPLASYTFEQNNPYLSYGDPLAVGVEILDTQGSLSQAALAFEAAVQRDPDNSIAWQYLGQTQAENEKEIPAVAALQKSVQSNPQNGSALMV